MKILLECFYSFVGSFCFAIIFNIKGNKAFFAGLGGALSQLAYILFGYIVSAEITQYLFATLITAVYAEIMARIKKSPATVFLVPSIIPLVPGGMMYYTMELCIAGKINEFTRLLLETLGVAGALAMGILIVSSINKAIKVASAKRKKLFHRR